MKIVVIRLSPRGYRDLRITTHCCLVARAFGAEKIVLDEESDPKIKKTVDGITKRFGGTFEVEFAKQPVHTIKALQKEGYVMTHLTMYGDTPTQNISRIRKTQKVGIIIGSEKVPPEVYQLADYNISITSQPHSEVAALAVFMHDLQKGKELEKRFDNAQIRIEPHEKGKRVTRLI